MPSTTQLALLLALLSTGYHVHGQSAQESQDLLCNRHRQPETFTKNLVTMGALQEQLLLVVYSPRGTFLVYHFPVSSLSTEKFDINLKLASQAKSFKDTWPYLYYHSDLEIATWETNYYALSTAFSLSPMLSTDEHNRTTSNLLFTRQRVSRSINLRFRRYIYNLAKQTTSELTNITFRSDNSFTPTPQVIPSDTQREHYLATLLLSNETAISLHYALTNVSNITVPGGGFFPTTIPNDEFAFDLFGSSSSSALQLNDIRILNFTQTCIEVEGTVPGTGQVSFPVKRGLCRELNKELMKGFVHKGRFYLFGSEGVFSFSEEAYKDRNKTVPLSVRRYADWITCSFANVYTVEPPEVTSTSPGFPTFPPLPTPTSPSPPLPTGMTTAESSPMVPALKYQPAKPTTSKMADHSSGHKRRLDRGRLG